jgi:hypothetical protein
MDEVSRNALIAQLAQNQCKGTEALAYVNALAAHPVSLQMLQRIARAAGTPFSRSRSGAAYGDPPNATLDTAVQHAMKYMGNNYGVRMLIDQIRPMFPPGTRISRAGLLQSMQRVNPAAAASRRCVPRRAAAPPCRGALTSPAPALPAAGRRRGAAPAAATSACRSATSGGRWI